MERSSILLYVAPSTTVSLFISNWFRNWYKLIPMYLILRKYWFLNVFFWRLDFQPTKLIYSLNNTIYILSRFKKVYIFYEFVEKNIRLKVKQ